VIHLLLQMARKVEEAANFDTEQLTVLEPGIYDKRHADCAGQDNIDLACERISQEMKESGSRLCSFETYKRLSLICHGRTDAPDVLFSPVLSSHAVSTITIL
jgi:hypothetical protein